MLATSVESFMVGIGPWKNCFPFSVGHLTTLELMESTSIPLTNSGPARFMIWQGWGSVTPMPLARHTTPVRNWQKETVMPLYQILDPDHPAWAIAGSYEAALVQWREAILAGDGDEPQEGILVKAEDCEIIVPKEPDLDRCVFRSDMKWNNER
jgi:hypothetical protein